MKKKITELSLEPKCHCPRSSLLSTCPIHGPSFLRDDMDNMDSHSMETPEPQPGYIKFK